jgi:radical SAM protein with 4Fe4S-binding SPASM domain
MKYDRCRDFLKRMLDSGYIQQNVSPSRAKIKRADLSSASYERFSLPFLSAPTSVDIFITSRCNLNCVHCFSKKGAEDSAELSIEELQTLFDQLEMLGVFEVRINGGEPLLHPEIAAILMNLKDRRFRKVILTNATMLDNKMAGLLKECDVTPTVSLDDSKAEGHDLFRGTEGSFERTVTAMRLLHENEVEYGVNFCIHNGNLSRWEDIMDLCVGCGASRIAFLDLKPAGRMKNNLAWVPDHREYLKALLELMAARRRYRTKIDVALDTFLRCQPLNESVQEAKSGYVSCQAGRTRLSVDSKGSVYPCNLVVSDPRWAMGNVRNASICDIWFSPKWSFFRGTTVSELSKCRSCENLRKCGDFYCRLLPYLESGDPLGPHPRCKAQEI